MVIGILAGSSIFQCIEEVALVLQGGGALGAYQAGVYEALAQSRLCSTAHKLEFSAGGYPPQHLRDIVEAFRRLLPRLGAHYRIPQQKTWRRRSRRLFFTDWANRRPLQLRSLA